MNGLLIALLRLATFGIFLVATTLRCHGGDVPGAQEIMAKELDPVARRISDWLKNEKKSDVRIETLTYANSELSATNSNLVKLGLADALKEQKLTIKPLANAFVTGIIKFILKDDEKPAKVGAIVIILTVSITDGPKDDFELETKNDVIKSVLLGVNWASAGNQPDSDRRSAQLTQEARLRIQGTGTKPRIGEGTKVRVGDYAVELAIRPRGNANAEYEPQTVEFGDGISMNKLTPYVPIAIDQQYEIRVYNYKSDFDAAAEVLVDGVNSLHFLNVERAKAFAPAPRFSHWLVPRGGNLKIAGWQRDNQQAERFVVSEFSKSVAAELRLEKTNEAIGTITVVLYPAWKEGEKGSLSATGKDEAYENPVTSETRLFGDLKTVISIRYALPK